MNDIQLEKIKRRLGIDVEDDLEDELIEDLVCLLYTSPSPRD